MSNIKQWLEENILTTTGKISGKRLLTVPSQIKEQLNEATSFIPSLTLAQRAKLYLLDQTSPQYCVVCGLMVTRISKNHGEGFKRCCSNICAMKDPERVRKIIKNTNYEDSIAKRRTTSFERYGVESPNQDPSVQAKQRASWLAHYGVSNPSRSELVKQKKRETFNTNFPEGSEKRAKHFKSIGQINLEKRWPWKTDIDRITKRLKAGESPLYLAQEYGVAYSTFYKLGLHTKKPRITVPHQRVITMIERLDIGFKINDRQVIKPKEIDIYVPGEKLGVEVNGLFWHSRDDTKVDHHMLEKKRLCDEAGVRLMQFYCFEVENRSSIVESIISNSLNKSKRVFARRCSIIEVDHKKYREFAELNHLSGYSHATVIYGLVYESNLVALMSFSRPRFNPHYEWEIVRYCSETGTSVIGGASRLFEHFLRQYSPANVISYADNRYTTGNLYNKLGMTYLRSTSPNYWYVDPTGTKLHSRLKFQKHKQKDLLDVFDPSLSEKQNMLNNGYRIIYDCGNSVWSWKNPLADLQ